MDQSKNSQEKVPERKPRGVFDGPPKPKESQNPSESPKENSSEKKQTPSEPLKEDFQDVFQEQKTKGQQTALSPKHRSQDQYTAEQADRINRSLMGDDLDDIEIEEEDIKLAEKLIFDGYTEIDVKMDRFPDRSFTICSTNAEEISFIDEVIFDMVKGKETADGLIDLPQNHINTMRNALFVALGYRGKDKTELCENRIQHLNTIKKAIMRIGDLEMDGKLEEAIKLKDSLKSALKARAIKVKRLPTPVIDFLSAEKYKFDRKMYKIMTTKGVVPKS